MDKEIWKPIKDFEKFYEISNYGRVKSLSRFHRTSKNYSSIGYYTKEKMLNPTINNKGYLVVSLYDGSKKVKVKQVHRLVAEAFIPNPTNLPEVNHRDENPQNPKFDNLEWCTHKENMNYGTRSKRLGLKHRKMINQYDKKGNFIKTWDCACEAAKELKLNVSNIISCCRNRKGFDTAGGYI